MTDEMKRKGAVWPDADLLAEFEAALKRQDRSKGTIEKYLRDVRAFGRWLAESGTALDEAAGSAWKENLLAEGYRPATVNSMVCGVNRFFAFLGREDLRMRTIRIQRKLFWEEERELSRAEFQQLTQAARREGRKQLALLMETIAGTGIRISELPYITVDAAKCGRATIHLKGKLRVILLPKKLCKRLCTFAKGKGMKDGSIFQTRNGTAISRKQVWAEMKALAVRAGVAPSKIFPHNLRHLFARCFYGESGDLVSLANLLGHSSMETTRIYLLTSQTSQEKQLNRLRLIC